MSGNRAPRSEPRLIVVTRIWPSAERPGRGIFVANRFRGIHGFRLVYARHQHRHWLLSLLSFVLDGLLVRGRFDGVEAHVLYPAGLVGYLAARLRGIPVVAYAHGTDVREVPNRGGGYRFFVRWVARHADAIVTNSEDTARHVRALGREPIIIPPGIDTDLFHPAPRPAQRRVLYLGGDLPRKGYDVAQQLADTLIGPGLRELPPAEVAALMHDHDIILMPSREEPFGLVAAEAIASGRWVVAGDVGGLRDIVTDGVNGTLVGDADFATAVAAVPDYDPFTIAATVEQFSLTTWQDRMARLWQDVLRSR